MPRIAGCIASNLAKDGVARSRLSPSPRGKTGDTRRLSYPILWLIPADALREDPHGVHA